MQPSTDQCMAHMGFTTSLRKPVTCMMLLVYGRHGSHVIFEIQSVIYVAFQFCPQSVRSQFTLPRMYSDPAGSNNMTTLSQHFHCNELSLRKITLILSHINRHLSCPTAIMTIPTKHYYVKLHVKFT